MGANLYQKIGILIPYIDEDSDTTHDLGRYNVTKKEHDKHLVKVPTLRNIEFTAPDLHTGSLTTLYDAVEFMLKYQVGIKQSDKNIKGIVKFLQTLTGDIPAILKESSEK